MCFNECGPDYLAGIWNEEVVGLNTIHKDLKLTDVTSLSLKK